MNEREPESDPLETAFRPMRARLEECPRAEELASFAGRTLPAGEAARVQAHVSRCGVCDSLVARIRDFDAADAAGSPEWAAVEGRLRSRVFPKPRWRRILLHPALAYGIAAAAVVVAALPGSHQAPATAPSAAPTIAMESVRTIDLNTERGDQAPNFVLEPGEKFVLLAFLIDIHPALHYFASLDGGPTREVVSTDGKGNFTLLVSRDLLGIGGHRLVVTEINPGKTERSFEFAFQL